MGSNIISLLSRFNSFLLSTAGVFLLFSCTSAIGNIDYLEQTLKLAGNNKIELLKVLEHYKNTQDTLKYKAAKFLISNMFVHGYIDRNNAQIVEVAKLEFKKTKTISNTTKGLLSKHEGLEAHITYDARKISSEYLINNIDLAFFEWKKRPWSKYYSFDAVSVAIYVLEEFRYPYACRRLPFLTRNLFFSHLERGAGYD